MARLHREALAIHREALVRGLIDLQAGGHQRGLHPELELHVLVLEVQDLSRGSLNMSRNRLGASLLHLNASPKASPPPPSHLGIARGHVHAIGQALVVVVAHEGHRGVRVPRHVHRGEHGADAFEERPVATQHVARVLQALLPARSLDKERLEAFRLTFGASKPALHLFCIQTHGALMSPSKRAGVLALEEASRIPDSMPRGSDHPTLIEVRRDVLAHEPEGEALVSRRLRDLAATGAEAHRDLEVVREQRPLVVGEAMTLRDHGVQQQPIPVHILYRIMYIISI